MTPLYCGRVRFDRGLLRTFTSPTLAAFGGVYGGVEETAGLPQLPGDHTGLCHTVPSLHAIGLIPDRAEPGSQGPVVWEPPPGWNAGRSLIRLPRTLLVLGAVSSDDMAGVAAALNPLGVTVVLTGGTLGWRGFAFAVPTTGMTELVRGETSTGVFQYRAAWTFAPEPCRGGDVQIVEANSLPYQYTGIGGGEGTDFESLTYTMILRAVSPPTAPAGTLFATADPNVKLLAYVDDAAAHRAVAAAFAAGCRSYRHTVLHPVGELNGVDSAAVYAALSGGSPFIERRRYNPTGPTGTRDAIVAAASAFFGG